MSVSHESATDELERALERESALRAALVEAHRERLASEDRLSTLVDEARVETDALREQLAEYERRLLQAEERARAEQVRRERLERLPPVRALKRVAQAPALAVLRERRARGFERDLDRERGRRT